MESIAGRSHASASVVNIMLQMNSKIRGKVSGSLPPISDANESKTNLRNNSADGSIDVKNGKTSDPFNDLSRNSNRTGKLPTFAKQNTVGNDK